MPHSTNCVNCGGNVLSVTLLTLSEPTIVSAQALFLQGAQLTVMVLKLRKEPGIF